MAQQSVCSVLRDHCVEVSRSSVFQNSSAYSLAAIFVRSLLGVPIRRDGHSG